MSGDAVLEDTFRAIATILAAVGVGGLIVDELRAARVGQREGVSADLAWAILWAAGLSVLFVVAWAS